MGKKFVTILVIFMAAVLVAYGGVSIWQTLHPVSVLQTGFDKRYGADTDIDDEGELTEEEINVRDYFNNTNVVNLLCLGLDRNEARDKIYTAYRTDTILLVSMNLDDHSVKMISVPRDSWVRIQPSGGQERVNTTLVYGGGSTPEGFANCVKTVSSVLGGIPIHYYFAVDMDVFQDVVDIMGGVWIDVEETACKIPDIPETGYQCLNSLQAMRYVRHRTGDSDIHRTARQRKFLIAMAKQMATLGQLKNIPSMYNSIKDNVFTDLTSDQIVALAAFATGVDLDNGITQYYCDGDYAWAGERSIWALSYQKMHDMLYECFGIDVWTFGFEDVATVKASYDQDPFGSKATPAPEATEETTESETPAESEQPTATEPPTETVEEPIAETPTETTDEPVTSEETTGTEDE